MQNKDYESDKKGCIKQKVRRHVDKGGAWIDEHKAF
jgi:hypothetical protein